jgi:hypothetical protein
LPADVLKSHRGHVNGVFQRSINGIRVLINNQIKKVNDKEGKNPRVGLRFAVTWIDRC